MDKQFTRRGFLAAGGAASLALAFSGCSFGTGESSGGGSGVIVWDISTGREQELMQEVANRFSSQEGNASVTMQFFQNDPYKNKLRTSISSGNPPDLFYGWGGGTLKSYVEAGEAHALPSSVNTDRYFSSVMEAVSFEGEVYGVPKGGTAPKVFYYNKQLFEEYGLSVPGTWSELMDIVGTLQGEGVVPIALAGQNLWTNQMYLEYLVNRIGGLAPFQGVVNGESDAWSDPAFIEANTMIQNLVSAGAFSEGFAALNADTGQDHQLLYSGEAAMLLQGAWIYPDILSDAPEFVNSGDLGWFNFPEVEGGGGDPEAIVGNLTNFYTIPEDANNKDSAAAFLDEAVMNDFMVQGMLDIGLVPPVNGIEDTIEGVDDSEWLLYIYGLARNAPYFDLSWDQALSPKAGQELLTNIGRIFSNEISPEQFSQNMNQAMDL